MTTHSETVRLLVTHPGCIDAAVERLGELAERGGGATVLSDLAAACYVRAQKEDRPSDLLRSLQAAEKAVAVNGKLPAAVFNLALAQETLGFTSKALATWKKAGDLDQSQWAQEARSHAVAIERQAAWNAVFRWPLIRRRLSDAVAVGDQRSLTQWIRPFPDAALRYVEQELLPGWASDVEGGRAEQAKRQLHEAAVISRTLAELTHDPYTREIVDAIEHAGRERLRLLVQGHAAFGNARRLERAYDVLPAEAAYAEAFRLLSRAHSPLRLGAQLGRAVQLSRLNQDSRKAKEILAAVDAESHEYGYLHVRGRAQANLANILRSEGLYLQSLDHFDLALQSFGRMNDAESLANVHSRKAGVLRALGHDEAAFSETVQARRYATNLVEMPARHVLAGETAGAVLGLEFPSIAFDYQSAFIEELEREDAAARGDENITKAIRVNRAIALRARAAIRVHLGDNERAQAELGYASSIAQQQADAPMRNALKARISEARAESAMRSGQPQAAVDELTDALAFSGSTQHRTFKAILLARRAEAYTLAGNRSLAEQDLRAAIEQVNEEEADLLKRRRRGQGEGLWGNYFSRFQETYFRLIRLLIARGGEREAFAYAEKSRAFEPLKLVLELPVADEALRSLDTDSVDPATLGVVQAALPDGTFVLEYQVGDDSTFVFIVSNGGFQVRELPVGKEQITRWTHELQREAVTGNVAGFDRRLSEPFAALLAVPLGAVAGMKHHDIPGRRLVIVPGRFMHGLPFAALRDGAGRHLIEHFIVSGAPSAALYVHARKRDAKLAEAGGNRKALFIGNPAFDEKLELANNLPPLPYAEAEARMAGALYEPDAKVLVAKEATVPAFLEAAKESAIVHVAGHAVVNRHAPFGTLLLMAPAKGHNGLLYAEELLAKLELNRARLVVLAACSSAGGVPVGPEGLAPLVRPIVAAGVPGVAGSLWTIGDQRSQRIMVEFHRQYRQGYDAAHALQLAQLRFLREEGAAMPALAWAPFQVVGYASSPFRAISISKREQHDE
ncbi:MAG: CHAT domain-containing protein [Acidobacteriota bacterium]|nr:CHAT domain-containing protein [Acidobacteriota bacterium]